MSDNDLNQRLRERFTQLPKIVQDAITSADVEKRMRALADTQKLHLDQWEALENEVMLALLGFQPVDDLEKNLKSEVGVSDEVAKALAEEISKIVFEPIRQELERQLKEGSAAAPAPGETASTLSASTAPGAAVVPQVAPATPPALPNEEKAQRAPISETYKPGEASTTRKDVHNDPYREAPV